MPDAIFENPRLAAVCDPLDPDRSDLDVFVRMVTEFGASTVLDASLTAAGFEAIEVRDAPDRPGCEFVFFVFAQKSTGYCRLDERRRRAFGTSSPTGGE